MLYEVRTCDVKPRTLPEVIKRMGEAYEHRRIHSEMLACWRTEIGPLNRIIQVWPYDDMTHRDAVRRAVAAESRWPPKIGEFVTSLRSEIMVPLDVAPSLQAGDVGPYFDYHSYAFPTGELAKIRSAWARALPDRLTYGPICAVWTTEIGELNRLVHIVPYRSLADYSQVRSRVTAGGQWPPSVKDVREGGPGYELLSQESMILLPVPFSPVR
jgi:hypothetical protein